MDSRLATDGIIEDEDKLKRSLRTQVETNNPAVQEVRHIFPVQMLT